MKKNKSCCHLILTARWYFPGLPPTGSWQDLKDHMREAGDVCFADVQRDGEGVVEFLRREDMEYALRRLDRTEFRSHQVSWCSDEVQLILPGNAEKALFFCFYCLKGETAFIRVFEERGTPNWGRSRSRSRSRGRYSPPFHNRRSPPPPPPPRYQSPPRHAMPRHSPPLRRPPPQSYSPPPRHYR